MILLQTAAVAFAMFSAIPVPQPTWNEQNMRWALAAFPLVGVVCGLGIWLWVWVCQVLGAPAVLRAGGLCLIPVLITGGIHLDGYADTCDALASWGDMEKRHAILKDPHCGAFALIRMCTYFAGYFALCGALEATPRAVLCLALGFVLERTLSGWAVAARPLAKNTGLAHTFATAADRKILARLLLILAAVLAAGLVLAGGAAMAVAAGLVLWRYVYVAKGTFGGISGDLCGWFLQKCELWMLAALVGDQLVRRWLA
ncbi:MAG: adenosylcobinamide-GDP ribazoletransferase [Eubacteriales bacterium]|nr:adenosylcobinamide-GDP ribazoletransferase [Eubacteriales bacterium]